MVYCEKQATKQTPERYNWGTKYELKIDNNEIKSAKLVKNNEYFSCLFLCETQITEIVGSKTNEEINQPCFLNYTILKIL